MEEILGFYEDSEDVRGKENCRERMIHYYGIFLALLTLLTVCFLLFLPAEMHSVHFSIFS